MESDFNLKLSGVEMNLRGLETLNPISPQTLYPKP